MNSMILFAIVTLLSYLYIAQISNNFMNKKGASGGDNVLTWNLAYIIFAVLFAAILLGWINGVRDGASLWEDFYAQEISRAINSGLPGDDVYIDITPASVIGLKNGILKSEMFVVDNVDNSVSVRLTKNSGTKFNYFNNVDAVNWTIELVSGSATTNRLHFQIVEVQK